MQIAERWILARLRHETVFSLAALTVKAFHHRQRVASHVRSAVPGRHTTVAEHMPKSYQAQLVWTPERITRWAETIGLQTRTLVEAIFARPSAPHEQGYRSCLSILRLAKRYGERSWKI